MGREMFEANRLGFVALWTEDLPAQRDALVAALGLEIRFQDENLVVFAMEGTDFVLRRATGENAHRAGTVQVGFYTDDLDSFTERLKTGNIPLEAAGRDIGAGQRATTIGLPGGHSIDVVGR